MRINEIFGPTIQGEGKSLGKRVNFLRLAMCNLYCVWCDTPYTWNWIGSKFEHPLKYDPKTEIHEMTNEEIVNKIQSLGDVKAVVISGGEPLIQHKQLTSLVKELKRLGYWIEVETNGTITPNQELVELVDQFNCSPKMENSGNAFKARLKPLVLDALVKNNKTNFKFVVSSEEDVQEILTYIKFFRMKEIYLMPEGRTLEELKSHEALVRELCGKYGFHFTNREHIIQFGPRRGV